MNEHLRPTAWHWRHGSGSGIPCWGSAFRGGGGLCCCGRGEKGEIITLRVGQLVNFVGGIFGVECLSGKFLVMLDWKFKYG